MAATLVALVLPLIWLGFARLLPPLRRRIVLSYRIAMALAWCYLAFAVLSSEKAPMTPFALLIGALLATWMLQRLMKNSQRKFAKRQDQSSSQ